jgi:hypothetical protein
MVKTFAVERERIGRMLFRFARKRIAFFYFGNRCAPDESQRAPSGAKRKDFEWELHLLTYREEG